MFLQRIIFVKVIFFRSSRRNLKEKKRGKVLSAVLVEFVTDVGQENEE